MENYNNKEYYIGYLEVFNEYLVNEMTASQIIFEMPCLNDQFLKILTAESKSKKEANQLFLDMMTQLPFDKNPGYFKEFLDALEKTGHEQIYKRLQLENVKDDDKFRKIIKKNRKDFEKATPLPLVQHLIRDDFINKDDYEHIRYMLSCKQANPVIMRHLLSVLPFKKENWFRGLIKALQKCNEIGILDSIDPNLVNDSDTPLTQIIYQIPCPENSNATTVEPLTLFHDNTLLRNLFSPQMHLICRMEITPFLEEFSRIQLISKQDYDELQRKSSKEAFYILLNKVYIDSNFLNQFIKVLIKIDQKDVLVSFGWVFPPIADETDPNEKIRDFVDNLMRVNSNSPIESKDLDFKSEIKKINLEKKPEIPVNHSDSCIIDLREYDLTSCSNECANFDVKNLIPTSKIQQSQLQEKILIQTKILISGLPQNITVENLLEHFDPLIDYIKVKENDNKSVQLLKDKKSNMNNGKAVIEFIDPKYALNAIDIFDDTLILDNQIKIKIAEKVIYSISSCSTGSILQMDSINEVTSTLIDNNLKLRSYQKELAQEAFKGKNCIIVAPTGSGKTHVAMAIIQNHIQNMKPSQTTKVIFFVPTVALVEQQKSLFEKYLKDQKILGMSGGDLDGQLPLIQLIPLNDIIVMTPQIMCNNLETDKSFSLSMLSLMIFDECHHATKEHPYTKIMGFYIDMVDRQVELPQIIGLTASVGVGKSKTNTKAIEYILKLCANMDCTTISTVKENLKELNEHVNKPNEKTQEVTGRQKDPFNDTIVDLMKQIEKCIINSDEAKLAENINPEIKSLMNPPPDRIGDPYTQWRSKFFALITAIYEQSIRRLFVSCLEYLKFFNEALLINADCRTKDAYSFCETKFKELYKDQSLENKTDIFLTNLWKESQPKLKAYSEDQNYENPKLNFIKKEIVDFYSQYPDMRCIMFCRTREMTKALVSWMNETEELCHLNATFLVGSNAPANRSGMTSVQQDDALKYFKEGKHKVIIATSVAEEGLDVQKCNLVIRYEHVTDSISRVQSRGRARAENARFLLISEKGRGAAVKDVNNQIREKMMVQAIEEISKMRYQEKQSRINKYQKESQTERRMASIAKKIQDSKSRNSKTNQERFELRCLKCDQFIATSDNIKKIEESHHVVLEPNYEDKIKILPHPNPIQYGLNFEKTGKTHCKKCNSDFGIQAIYKNVPFFVIKPESFIIINLSNNQRQQYKKWKKVPFKVSSLTDQDLSNMMNRYIDNECSNNYTFGNDAIPNSVYDDDDDDDEDSDDDDGNSIFIDRTLTAHSTYQ